MEDLAELAAALHGQARRTENVEQIDACYHQAPPHPEGRHRRLRRTAIKALGATGSVRPSAKVMQIVSSAPRRELLAVAP
jgi:hypothetical protein